MLRRAVASPESGLVKLMLTRALLHARRDHAALFRAGSHTPVQATGTHAERVVAFVREHEGQAALVVAPRLTVGLGSARRATAPLGDAWGDTALRLDGRFVRPEWRCALTGRTVTADDGRVRLATLLTDAPAGCWLAELR